MKPLIDTIRLSSSSSSFTSPFGHARDPSGPPPCARPVKSTSKSMAAKSGAERPARNAAFCFGKIGAVLGAVRRRADVDDARVLLAGVLVADGVADVGMPPDRVAGLDFRDGDQAGHQFRVPLGADAERTAGPAPQRSSSATSSCNARRRT